MTMLSEKEKEMILNALSNMNLNDNLDKADALLDLINEFYENLDCIIKRYEE